MKFLYVFLGLLIGINCFAEECPSLTGVYSKCVTEITDDKGTSTSQLVGVKYTITQNEEIENEVKTAVYKLLETDEDNNTITTLLVADNKERKTHTVNPNDITDTSVKFFCEKGTVRQIYTHTIKSPDEVWSSTSEYNGTYQVNSENKFIFTTVVTQYGIELEKSTMTCSKE